MKTLDRTSRALLAFAVLNLILTTAAVRLFAPRDLPKSSAAQVARFALGHASADSWKPMLLALDKTRAAPAEPIYQDLFFRRKIKFQYPPSSLLSLDLLQTALGHPPPIGLLNGISWIAVLLIAVIVPAIYLRLTKERPFPPLDRRIQVATLAFLTLTFYPITRGYALGQIQTCLTCLFAVAVLAWVGGRELLAGVLIGAIVSVKPQFSLFLVWAAVHRRRDFLIGSASSLLLLESFSLWRYGLANQLDYLSVLAYLSAHGESFFANQSVNGILARALHVGNNFEWDAHAFPPYHPVVHYGTLLPSVLWIAIALLWRRKQRTRDVMLLKFALAALLFTMASPIAWEHHYGILAPIYAVAFALLPAARIPLACSYFLTANALPFANRAADTSWNFVQSHLFAGAIALVVIVLHGTPSGHPTRAVPTPLRTSGDHAPCPAVLP